MLNMIEDIVGLEYAPAVYWAVIALIALVALLIILAVVRRLRSGTNVVGGRNRKARLSIMDAAAVDTHRRLVLVRRDDVEHLLLIGGNSDIVVERDIRPSAQPRRQAPVQETIDEPRTPAPAPRPAPHPVAAPARAPAPAPAPRVTPSLATPSRLATPARTLAPAARTKDQLDDDLMKELESALDIEDAAPEAAKPRPSLDDEMSKLLGELTNQKR